MVPTISSELRWLMDRACEWGVYVRLVLPETMDQVAQWNVPCPRWWSKDVFAALHELERLGWIRFLLDNFIGDEIPVEQPTFDDQALIDAYRSRRQVLSYRLTDAGGVAWEQSAKPIWPLRYVFDVREPVSQDDEGECVVTAPTEDVARKAFLVTACQQNLLVVPGTERYVPCGRWNPTYWRKMESGFQVSAATAATREESEINIESLLPLATQRRCYEYVRLLHGWYAPVDERDWQRREYLRYGGMWN